MYFLAALAAGFFFVSLANAAIPTGYTGKPYPPGSAPHEIPGRVNFHDYDYVPPSLGQSNNVTFLQDDQAYGGVSGGGDAAGRDGKIAGVPVDSDNAWPAFFATNKSPYDLDTFYAAGKSWPNGVRYPDPVDTAKKDEYIGASHADGWTKFTIHVPKAGKYWISSIFAEQAPPLQFHINFMNGTQTVSTPTVKYNGMPASYHAWMQYSDFASIQLDSGVQVMQFQNEANHINQDFLYIAADSGQFTTAIRSSTGKAPSSGSFNIAVTQSAVRFSLRDAGRTRVSVFDCLGREILAVADQNMTAGTHTAEFNAAALRQGVYFMHVKHNAENAVVRFEVIAR
jgi:hypothetical protein